MSHEHRHDASGERKATPARWRSRLRCSVALLAFYAIVRNTAAPSPSDQIDWKKAGDLITRSEQTGLITGRTCVGNKAYVKPAKWLSLDAQGKQDLVLALARLCKDQGSGDRMTVLDSQSRREMGSYSGRQVELK